METHFTHFTLVFSLRKYRLTHLMLIKSTLYNNNSYHITNNYTYIIGIIGIIVCIFEHYRYLCLCHILQNTCSSHTAIYCTIEGCYTSFLENLLPNILLFILLFDMPYPAKLIYKCAMSYKLTCLR